MARPFAQWTKVWALIDKVGDAAALSAERVKPLASAQWGWGDNAPNLRNFRVSFGSDQTKSLYYNGLFFCRLMFPFFVGVMFRWSASAKPAYLQAHVGWKLNGRLALAFRLQTDDSAAAGMDYINTDQARGWADGAK